VAVPFVWHEFTYLGSYCSDGKFRAASTHDRLFPSRCASPGPQRPVDVPPSVLLGSYERVVPDFEPPAHAVAAVKGHGVVAEGRDALVRLVYGREKTLRAPHYVTTDSNQHLIISDPGLPGVHVLDSKRRNSFRIVAGEGHRLRSPSGVAVDGDNNIYVADSQRGMVFVYATDGTFIRRIGDLGGGEGLFHHPTAIAIDRAGRHLYALDSPRLFLLDLQGNVLQRVGKLRGETGPFSNPTDLGVANQQLLVLDGNGSRVHVMDLQCNLLRSVTLSDSGIGIDSNLAVDHVGNIYVSAADAFSIRIYNHEGGLLGASGSPGSGIGEFDHPNGLWIDSNRLYVSDTNNARVQVFGLQPSGSNTGQGAGLN
jgi:DNA-binding beta-propeller fold protein YncE